MVMNCHVTIALAILVTLSKSFWAPVVTLLKIRDSATLPPRAMHILSKI